MFENIFDSYQKALSVQTDSPEASEQTTLIAKFKELLGSSQSFSRYHFVPGHFTGSALIVTTDFERVLLTHHRKLNLWLQLGGHADDNSRLWEVAYREGIEESGLGNLSHVQWAPKFESPLPLIFDLDIHFIPEHKAEPGHYHYDVRYLFTTSTPDKIAISPESNELRWFNFAEAYDLTKEPSMHRQFKKAQWVRELL